MKRFSEKATREALTNGATIRDNAHYTLNAGYRVHIDGEQVGYITSDLFGKLLHDGTIAASFHGYSYTDYMTPDQITAAQEAAAAELDAIRTPGNIEIRARRACTIGNRRVRDGEHFIIQVYGDGTQASPANAYGKLYDFRTADHAHLFTIVSRPEPAQVAELSAVIDAEEEEPAQESTPAHPWVTPAALAQFVRLFDGTQTADYVPSVCGECGRACRRVSSYASGAPCMRCPVRAYMELKQDRRGRKGYMLTDTGTTTHSAAQAMTWHREGRAVAVVRRGFPGVVIRGASQKGKTREDENWEHCRNIAHDIDAYVNGEYKRCPDCGEIHQRDWDDIADVFRCPECGSVGSVDDWDTLSIWEYLDDFFDLEYRCGSDKKYRSCRVMIACGGPNIYLDTASGAVELYWWNERASYPISSDAAELIDEWAAELWSCL